MPREYQANRYLVHGHVQGVGFRYSTVRQAQRLKLTGWVRNTIDGNVEIVAEGMAVSISEFSKWVKKGPTGSRVLRVDVTRMPVTGTYSRFSVEY